MPGMSLDPSMQSPPVRGCSPDRTDQVRPDSGTESTVAHAT